MTYKVSVTYTYKKNGSNTQTSSTYDVEGKTESAVLARLRKQHPGCEFVIQKIEWRS
jgi:hypothetical protein